MALLWIVLGLALLIFGGELLVRSAAGLALKMKISPLVVGLTVVSLATSAPELIVSLEAALSAHPDIAIGNIVGSNIANVGLILGLTAAFFVMPVIWRTYRLDWAFMLLATAILGISIAGDYVVRRWEGTVMVIMLVGYVYHKIMSSRKEEAAKSIPVEVVGKPTWYLTLLLIASVIALKYGAGFLIDGTVEIALDLGVEERIISLTVVAFGTSIPELVASIMSALKGEREIAIGNVIGSNIFNILGVLGFSSLIVDIPVLSYQTLTFDYWWMLGFSLAVWPLMRYFTRGSIGRLEGGILLTAYVLYVLMLVGAF